MTLIGTGSERASWSGSGIINSAFSPATRARASSRSASSISTTTCRTDPTGANGVVRLVNIYGFFIEGMGDVDADGIDDVLPNRKSVIGRIMTIPVHGHRRVDFAGQASFLRQIILVR